MNHAVFLNVIGGEDTQFHGKIQDSGDVSAEATSLYIRQSGLIKSNGSISFNISERYDQRGDIIFNSDVVITTEQYMLYSTHDLSNNLSCLISGTRLPGSVDANGCLETEDTGPPTWPSGSTLTASDVEPTSITLTWTAAVDDVEVTGYNIFQDGMEIAQVDGSTLTYAVADLTPDTEYTFKVEAGDAAGNWSSDGPSETVITPEMPDTGPPTWPVESSLTASNIGATGLTLTWTEAVDDKGVTDYKVFQDGMAIAAVDASVLTLDVTGLSPETAYTFKVEAGDAVNNWSIDGPSESVTTAADTTAPAWPSGSTLTASNVTATGLTLTWTPAADDVTVTGYRIFMDSVEIATVGAAVLTYDVSGLSPETLYAFNVEAGDAYNNWSVDGPTTFATTSADTTAPQWPAGSTLTASDIMATSLTLTWTPAVDDVGVTNYRLYKDGLVLATVAGSVLTYHVTGLLPETAYTFKVEAGDAYNNWSVDGPTDVSTTAPDTTDPSWPPGSSLTASDVEATSLTLTWTEAQDDVAVTGYVIYQDGIEIAQVDAATFSYSVIGLSPETAYGFNVQATDAYSNLSADGPSTSTTSAADTTPPQWPAGSSLTASDITATSLALSWTAATDDVGVSGYRIYQDGLQITAVGAGVLTYDVTGLSPETAYTFKVEAGDAYDNWSADGPSTAPTTAPDTTPPQWPAGSTLSASDITATGLVLTWTAATDDVGVTNYKVFQDGFEVATFDASILTYSVSGLTPETQYTFKVEAGDGYDNWSTDGPSVIETAAPDTTPPEWPAGSAINASNIEVTSLTLSWTEAQDDVGVTDYRLFQNGLEIATIGAGVQTYDVTGLSPETEYTFNVEAGDGYDNWSTDGPSTMATTPADTTPPQWPAGSMLSASNVEATSLTLTWTEAQDDVGVTGYRIFQDGIELATVGAAVMSYDVTGLSPETAYTFKVEAGDTAENWSTDGPSVPVTTAADTIPPQWPAGSSLSASDISATSLILTWTEATDDVGVTSYRVYQDGIELATVDVAVLSYEVTSLLPETGYSFKVEAGDAYTNWSIDGPSTTVTTAQDTTPPWWPAGSTLNAIDVDVTSLTLTWTEAADDVEVTHYAIFQDGFLLTTVNASILTYEVAGLTPDTNYMFNVEAMDAVPNISMDGPSLNVMTLPDTSPPAWPAGSSLTASDIEHTSLTLTWTEAQDDVETANYRLFQDGIEIVTVDATVLTYDVTGLNPETIYTFKVEAGDAADNWSTDGPSTMATTPAAPDTDPPTWPAGSSLTASDVLWSTLILTWTEAEDDVAVTDYRVFQDGTEIATVDASILTYNVTGLSPETEYIFSIEAGDTADNWSTDGPSTTITTLPELPPDPSLVATPIDRTVATTVFTATEFLYTGPDPIQTGVAPDTIAPVRVAVLKGKVKARDGSPLPGVAITILNHPEYGSTLTRLDGEFDMAVNGGSKLTVDYEREGYLSAQREADVPWQDYERLPDIVMIPMDDNSTFIDLSAPIDYQVAEGSEITDEDGARQGVLLFPQGTQAVMHLPDGSTQPLDTMHVNITEYTVGESGPEAMPALLPPSVLYEYCVEISAQEAMAQGASMVSLNQPIPYYFEDFLDFPVGAIVPTGYYDRDKGAWVPMPDGRVIEILGITGGLADLDTNGDGEIDDPGEIDVVPIPDAEREKLAQLYAPGQNLKRALISHFSILDCNDRRCLAPDAQPPTEDDPEDGEPDNEDPSDPCESSGGSVIKCQSQTLGESINIAGSSFSLSYAGDRVPGRKAPYKLGIPVGLGGEGGVPETLGYIKLIIEVAGRTFEYEYPPDADLTHTFVWDGEDAYGRKLQGRQPISVSLCPGYEAVYMSADYLVALEMGGSSFARACCSDDGGGGSAIVDNILPRFAGNHFEMCKEWQGVIGSWEGIEQGLGGWDLDVHHAYDPVGRVLYLGDGRKRSAENTLLVITRAAGIPDEGCYSGDHGPATQAKLGQPRSVAVAADGSLFIADSGNNVIRKVVPGGIITTVAGGGTAGPPDYGDGGPAIDARFFYPNAVAVGPDGSMYIVDGGKVRKVDAGPDGMIDGSDIIDTVAGNGNGTYNCEGPAVATDVPLPMPVDIDIGPNNDLYILGDIFYGCIHLVGQDGIMTVIAGSGDTYGDGIPATESKFARPAGIAVAPDGGFYVADCIDNKVRYVDSDRIIHTFAGTGVWSYNGDGIPAKEANLGYPDDVEIGPDGSVYIVDVNNYRIRRVNPQGIISTFAGRGKVGFGDYGGDDGPASGAQIRKGNSVAVGPDGSVYFADHYAHVIRRVNTQIPGFSLTDILITSQDGTELYHFDQYGRHMRTLNALTGGLLVEFGYTPDGLLESVTDGDGNVTLVQRDGDGVVQAIVAPFGQSTALGLDARGYLETITNPAGEVHQFTYYTDDFEGLMESHMDPRLNEYTYGYDTLGRLVGNLDPVGGGNTLDLTLAPDMPDIDRGYKVDRTTAEGRITSYLTEYLETGDARIENTFPGGLKIDGMFVTDGSREIAYPDGTVVSYKEGPDPRWGMNSPLMEILTIATPGGLQYDLTTEREVTLTDPLDPSSLETLTDTVTINDKSFVSIFNAGSGLWTSQSAEGRERYTMVDDQGRVLVDQVALLQSMNFSYDSFGRLETISQGPPLDPRVFSIGYDSNGNVENITDPEAHVVSFEYDDAGRVTKQVLPDLREIIYSYDENGNIESITPPGRPAHEFEYTAVDLMQEYDPPYVSPAVDTTHYTYNLDRQIDLISRPDGQTIDYTYDTAGRLDTITMPRGVVDYAYDPATGNLFTITDPDGGMITYGHDGSLFTDTAWTGEVSGSIHRVYDDDFRIDSRTVNGAHLVSFVYDNDGLVIQVGDEVVGRKPENGLIESTTLGNVGTTTGYNGFGEFDNFGAAYDGSSIFSTGYIRDKLGRITQLTETVDGTTTVYEYAYDEAGRLDTVTKDGILVSDYDYDLNGNRLAHTTPEETVTGTYDNQDRMLTYGDAVYTYTENGELLTKTVDGLETTYYYDVFGNLTGVDLPDGTEIRYVIDGMNRRIGKKVDGTLVQGFLYKDALNPIAELDGSGAVVSRFVYGTKFNVPDYMIRYGVTYRIISDHLGSPRLVINTTDGTTAQQITYDEFGNVLDDTNPGFQPFGFAGGIYDWDSGLMRFGYRDYDPEVGRWTSKDPILFSGGVFNLYGYVLNNPINSIDILGLMEICGWLSLAGGGAVVVGVAIWPIGVVLIAAGVVSIVADIYLNMSTGQLKHQWEMDEIILQREVSLINQGVHISYDEPIAP